MRPSLTSEDSNMKRVVLTFFAIINIAPLCNACQPCLRQQPGVPDDSESLSPRRRRGSPKSCKQRKRKHGKSGSPPRSDPPSSNVEGFDEPSIAPYIEHQTVSEGSPSSSKASTRTCGRYRRVCDEADGSSDGSESYD